MLVTHWCFVLDSLRKAIRRLNLAVAVVCFGLAAGQGQAGEVTRRGRSLADALDAMHVETRWLPGPDIVWKTGLPLEPGEVETGPRPHSAAFVAAACARLRLDVPPPLAASDSEASRALCEWLRTDGPAQGWRAVSNPVEAQRRANAGEVVIVAFKAADPARDGHVAIVRPSAKSTKAVHNEGPQVIQAGFENSRSVSLKTGVRQHARAWPDGVRYFAHKRPVPPPRPRGIIDARQAVQIAERFVRDNGYTDYVPENIRRLEPERLEFSASPREWYQQRHASLQPQAVGYRKGGRNDPEGWTIGFALVEGRGRKPDVGRGVSMDARGHSVTMEHMGFYLTGLEPRPD